MYHAQYVRIILLKTDILKFQSYYNGIVLKFYTHYILYFDKYFVIKLRDRLKSQNIKLI